MIKRNHWAVPGFSALALLTLAALVLIDRRGSLLQGTAGEVQDQVAGVVEHARHQASRLALLLSQVPVLAESLGDLVLVDPEMSQSLLYAHLIDGLRRTPAAQTAAVAYGTPIRSALMERGATSGRPMTDGGELARPPGWHVLYCRQLLPSCSDSQGTFPDEHKNSCR